jgi:thiol:disulfide interchange protein DsbA
MKRRDFSLLTSACLSLGLTGLASLSSTNALAQRKPPEAGQDYKALAQRAPVEAPAGKIEVVEFFWYNCTHCNAFEPSLSEWVRKLPKFVAFRRVPRRFADNEIAQQQLYYALEAMGLIEKLHTKVFAAIHVEKQQLNTPTAITDWVAKQGVNKAEFTKQFESFTAISKANKAKQLQDAYQIEGVPALGVAGRFITDAGMAGGNARALQVVDALVESVRKGA